MELSITIQAHNTRVDHIDYYKTVLSDFDVELDDVSRGMVENCYMAWRSWEDSKADYHLVLQDDLLITSNFYEKLMVHLSKGYDVYHLYLGQNKKRLNKYWKNAIKEGKDHILLDDIHAAQAVCIKTKHIPEMLKVCRSLDYPVDDMRINKFVRSNGFKVYFPLPCLVEHLNGESLHNFNKSPKNKRVAVWYEQ